MSERLLDTHVYTKREGRHGNQRKNIYISGLEALKFNITVQFKSSFKVICLGSFFCFVKFVIIHVFLVLADFVWVIWVIRRQCGPVVRALALRSGDPGFKTRPDHSLNLILNLPPASWDS